MRAVETDVQRSRAGRGAGRRVVFIDKGRRANSHRALREINWKKAAGGLMMLVCNEEGEYEELEMGTPIGGCDGTQPVHTGGSCRNVKSFKVAECIQKQLELQFYHCLRKTHFHKNIAETFTQEKTEHGIILHAWTLILTYSFYPPY